MEKICRIPLWVNRAGVGMGEGRKQSLFCENMLKNIKFYLFL